MNEPRQIEVLQMFQGPLGGFRKDFRPVPSPTAEPDEVTEAHPSASVTDAPEPEAPSEPGGRCGQCGAFLPGPDPIPCPECGLNAPEPAPEPAQERTEPDVAPVTADTLQNEGFSGFQQDADLLADLI
jgi:hypothetical protein